MQAMPIVIAAPHETQRAEPIAAKGDKEDDRFFRALEKQLLQEGKTGRGKPPEKESPEKTEGKERINQGTAETLSTMGTGIYNSISEQLSEKKTIGKGKSRWKRTDGQVKASTGAEGPAGKRGVPGSGIIPGKGVVPGKGIIPATAVSPRLQVKNDLAAVGRKKTDMAHVAGSKSHGADLADGPGSRVGSGIRRPLNIAGNYPAKAKLPETQTPAVQGGLGKAGTKMPVSGRETGEEKVPADARNSEGKGTDKAGGKQTGQQSDRASKRVHKAATPVKMQKGMTKTKGKSPGRMENTKMNRGLEKVQAKMSVANGENVEKNRRKADVQPQITGSLNARNASEAAHYKQARAENVNFAGSETTGAKAKAGGSGGGEMVNRGGKESLLSTPGMSSNVGIRGPGVFPGTEAEALKKARARKSEATELPEHETKGRDIHQKAGIDKKLHSKPEYVKLFTDKTGLMQEQSRGSAQDVQGKVNSRSKTDKPFSLGKIVKGSNEGSQENRLAATTFDRVPARLAGTPENTKAQVNNIVEQIVTKIKAGVTDYNRSTLEVSLRPEHLGRVKIQLHSLDGMVSIRVTAENGEAVNLLNANIQSIRDSIEEQGIRLQDLGVAMEDHRGEGSPSGNDKGGQNRKNPPAGSGVSEEYGNWPVNEQVYSMAKSGLDLLA